MSAPDISIYEELDLTGMEITPFKWRGERLKASFGSGRGASARVGAAHGIWGWEISSDVLPDDEDYGNMVNGLPRMEYYTDFIRRHTLGTRDIFLIDFRGRKYHASFAENKIGGNMLSYDVFDMSGVEIEMRTVAGFHYGDHGNVIDPGFYGDDVWAWIKGGSYTHPGGYQLTDQSGNGHHMLSTGNVVPVTNLVNGLAGMRLNSGTADGFFATTEDPTIYEALFLLKIREASFSSIQGILTGGTTGQAFVGASGTTKLINQAVGSSYAYWLNGELLTEATQECPMNDFGVIHGRWANGIALSNLQIGKDRNNSGRFGKLDLVEGILKDVEPFTDEVAADLDGYLMRRGAIS